MRCFVCLTQEVSEDSTEDHYFVDDREVCSLVCFINGIGGRTAVFSARPIQFHAEIVH